MKDVATNIKMKNIRYNIFIFIITLLMSFNISESFEKSDNCPIDDAENKSLLVSFIEDGVLFIENNINPISSNEITYFEYLENCNQFPEDVIISFYKTNEYYFKVGRVKESAIFDDNGIILLDSTKPLIEVFDINFNLIYAVLY